MFNNLIESTSHSGEFKRRGSFVLITTVTYVLLFIIAGVMSIYAYDARLEDQNVYSVNMLSPVEMDAPKPAATNPKATPPKGNSSTQPFAERAEAIAPISRPDVVPDKVSAQPSKHLPLPVSGIYAITGRDLNPGVPAGNGSRDGGTAVGGNRVLAVDVGMPPEMPPVHPPVPKTISKGPITGDAKFLPKPAYPVIARQAGAAGPVNVQVLIDESGKVVSAKAVTGHPLLRAAAQQAAYLAKFSPTTIGDQPVKVSGVITYNFVLQ